MLDEGKTAPEGWVHPEAVGQDVSMLAERKRGGFDFARTQVLTALYWNECVSAGIL